MNNIFRLSPNERQRIITDFQTNNLVEPDDICNVLSRIPTPLTNTQLIDLKMNTSPLANSSCDGIDIYGDVVKFVEACIAT